MTSDVPETVLRRRKLFDAIRAEIHRLKPDETRVNLDLTDADMLESLKAIEQTLEYAEVARLAKEYCDQLEREAASGRD